MRTRAIVAIAASLAIPLVAVIPASAVTPRMHVILQQNGHGNGLTRTFTVGAPWRITFNYFCISKIGSSTPASGEFFTAIYEADGTDSMLTGPYRTAAQGAGAKTEGAAGDYVISVSSESQCSWNLKVQAASGHQGPQPTRAARLHIPHTIMNDNSSGDDSTPAFHVNDDWQLDWSYDCTKYGSAGNFIVEVENANGSDNVYDGGPNKLGRFDLGATREPRGGYLALQVISECDWTVSAYGSQG